MNAGRSPTLDKEDPPMDTHETPTGLSEATEQGEGSDAVNIQTY